MRLKKMKSFVRDIVDIKQTEDNFGLTNFNQLIIMHIK